ncbi:MAG: uroporphyrinogen decarboxylase [Thermoplasmatota archaeon]
MNGLERFRAVLAGKHVDRPPVWMLRQAGRYLPEYRALRESYTFEAMLAKPDVATEITLQPVRRFDFDCAIVFSDILLPLGGMGRPARFGEHGPEIEHPVRTRDAVDTLRVPDPQENVPFLAETIRRVGAAVPEKAVLGFAAAPFTLASYLVEGHGSKDFGATKTFAHSEPEAWEALLDRARRTIERLVSYQFDAGATAVQLFDTWVEVLSPRDYERWALPHVQELIRHVRRPGRPIIYFTRGTAGVARGLPKVGADAYSVDWRIDLRDARALLGPEPALQGNLDPTALLAPPKVVEEETRLVLEAGDAAKKHIFNLGHGVLPPTPIASVEALVHTVKSWTHR